MSRHVDARRWEEIQATFDTMVELDVAEREKRLAAVASTDPDLRAAVDALLAADSEASVRLAPLEELVRSPSVAVPPQDPLGLAGRTISHFEVGESIGAGGMGVVYRAQDTRLHRPVALKFMHPSYSFDETARARFLREAHSAATLDHPSLCAIHEVGSSDDGWLFLAMPLYAGETLHARLARHGSIPVREALEIARQIAEGLQVAHAAGVVHRDLKPGNVMLLPDGTARILDFGLAKARDQSLTESGAVLGTVSHMAPEQIRGETVDGRADLWALGVVLYQMLTARKPFDNEQDIAVAHAVLYQDPVPPSTHRGDVPVAVEDVVLRLLQKDRAKRYSSAADLLGDLARVGTAAADPRYSLRRHLRRTSRLLARNRSRVMAVGATAVLIAAGAYAAFAREGATSATPPPRMAIAVLPFRNLGGDSSRAYFVDGLHEEILSQLNKVRGLKVIGRNSVRGYSGPNVPPYEQIGRELAVGSIVDASVQALGSRVRVNIQLIDAQTESPLWVERYDRTLDDAFELQSEIARQILATVGVVLSGSERTALVQVPTAKKQAYLLYLQARDYERRPGLRRANLDSAIALYERAVALDPKFALARAALSGAHGNMYWTRADMTPARLASQRTEANAALGLAPDLPQAHEAMAGVHNVGPETDVKQAIEQIRIALSGAPNDAQLWRGLARSYRRLADWERFEAALRRAAELDPRNVDLLADDGAFTYERMGRFAEKLRWEERAASLTGDTLGFAMSKAWTYLYWKGQTDTLRAIMNGEPGRIFRRNGWLAPVVGFRFIERQPDSVLQMLKGVRPRVFQGALGFAPTPIWAAYAHQMRGDQRSARIAFDSALAMIDSAMKTFSDDWPLHQARGMALAGLGRRAEALGEVRKMRESFIYRKDFFLRPFVVIGIAIVLAHAGELDSAINELESLLSDEAPALTVHALRLEPVWDPLREHPRFRALLARYGSRTSDG